MTRSVARKIGRGKRNDGGFTLIEVMFAAIYLAIGLLGIAAMQDIALSRNNDAKRLGIATNLATEMLERVRWNAPANSTSFPTVGYLYNNSPTTPFQVCNWACPGGSSPGNATFVNNATANDDYNQWLARISQNDPTGAPLLPNATGTVTSTALVPSTLGQVQITVSVSWTSGLRTPTVTMSTIVAPL